MENKFLEVKFTIDSMKAQIMHYVKANIIEMFPKLVEEEFDRVMKETWWREKISIAITEALSEEIQYGVKEAMRSASNVDKLIIDEATRTIDAIVATRFPKRKEAEGEEGE